MSLCNLQYQWLDCAFTLLVADCTLSGMQFAMLVMILAPYVLADRVLDGSIAGIVRRPEPQA